MEYTSAKTVDLELVICLVVRLGRGVLHLVVLVVAQAVLHALAVGVVELVRVVLAVRGKVATVGGARVGRGAAPVEALLGTRGFAREILLVDVALVIGARLHAVAGARRQCDLPIALEAADDLRPDVVVVVLGARYGTRRAAALRVAVDERDVVL